MHCASDLLAHCNIVRCKDVPLNELARIACAWQKRTRLHGCRRVQVGRINGRSCSSCHASLALSFQTAAFTPVQRFRDGSSGASGRHRRSKVGWPLLKLHIQTESPAEVMPPWACFFLER